MVTGSIREKLSSQNVIEMVPDEHQMSIERAPDEREREREREKERERKRERERVMGENE